jgi:hypothetical protein
MFNVGDVVKSKRELCGEILLGKVSAIVNEPLCINGAQFAGAVYEIKWNDGDVGPRVRESEIESTAPTPTRKAHGTPPDTSMILGAERKAWLESHGGATQFIRDAIDAAMAAEQAS